jgi:thioesterase domain-containing protein
LSPELREQLRTHKEALLEFLRAAAALASQQRAIVPLQPRGEHVPIFAVPGHSGDVFCWRGLAQALGESQPFYGLQPPGLDGSEPLTSVGALAGYFATQITAFRADGPYAIAGFCAGGTIAFELARQLLERGRPVRYLALFASPYPHWYRRFSQWEHRLVMELERGRGHLRAIATQPGDWHAYLGERLRQRRLRSGIRVEAEQDSLFAWKRRVEAATLEAVRRYTPPAYPARLSLFLPDSGGLRGTLLRWKATARAVDQYEGAPGCDGDWMLREPFVAFTAEQLRQCRERSASEGARADAREGEGKGPETPPLPCSRQAA